MSQHYSKTRQPVRTIPTKEQLAYAARRQAQLEADAEGDYEVEEEESYYETRLPTSARRYQGYALSPEEVYQSGNTRYHVRYVDVPVKRKSRQAQLPQQEREVYTDEMERVPQAKHRSLHPIAWFGIF